MLNPQRAITNEENDQPHHDHHGDEPNIRDIHALTPPHPPPVNRGRRRDTWENTSHRSSANSVSSEVASSENFTTMSREFNALVLAGSAIENNETDTMMNNNNNNNDDNNNNNNSHLARIGEDEIPEETNPLAIVPNNSPLESGLDSRGVGSGTGGINCDISVQRVKKEEVEMKISAWQNAKISKTNNRFKREEAIINGWESEQVEKANCWMKKVEVISFIVCMDDE